MPGRGRVPGRQPDDLDEAGLAGIRKPAERVEQGRDAALAKFGVGAVPGRVIGGGGAIALHPEDRAIRGAHVPAPVGHLEDPRRRDARVVDLDPGLAGDIGPADLEIHDAHRAHPYRWQCARRGRRHQPPSDRTGWRADDDLIRRDTGRVAVVCERNRPHTARAGVDGRERRAGQDLPPIAPDRDGHRLHQLPDAPARKPEPMWGRLLEHEPQRPAPGDPAEVDPVDLFQVGPHLGIHERRAEHAVEHVASRVRRPRFGRRCGRGAERRARRALVQVAARTHGSLAPRGDRPGHPAQIVPQELRQPATARLVVDKRNVSAQVIAQRAGTPGHAQTSDLRALVDDDDARAAAGRVERGAESCRSGAKHDQVGVGNRREGSCRRHRGIFARRPRLCQGVRASASGGRGGRVARQLGVAGPADWSILASVSALYDSPLRLAAFCLAAVMMIPAGWISLRHMLELRPADDAPRARALEAVWSIAPLIGLVALLIWAGVQ